MKHNFDFQSSKDHYDFAGKQLIEKDLMTNVANTPDFKGVMPKHVTFTWSDLIEDEKYSGGGYYNINIDIDIPE
jgi:hypothetical protein